MVEYIQTRVTAPGAKAAIDTQGLKRELKSQVSGEVRFDTGSLGIYSTDGSNYRHVPIGVVIPKTPEDVEAAVAACRKFGAPICSRGCGTSLTGQSCNTAVIFDFSKYMNRMLDVDPEKKLARVQPGLILDHLRGPLDAKYHLTFGPDPATHNHCTFGGMIGNNSCGIHSVMAGRTVDNVHELEILTYDGLRMRVGPTSDEELARIVASGGQRGKIYRDLKDLRDRYADTIRNRYPKTPRRSSGYSLDELLPEHGFHVARSLVGSEGTCAIVLEATLNLVYSPPAKTLLVLGYPDVFVSGDHVPQIMEYKPIGLEGLDDLLVEFMKKKGLHPQYATLLPEGGGWLLVEFGGANKEESDGKARALMDDLKKKPNAPSMKLFDNDEEEHLVWQVRESGLGATANVPGLPLSWPGWEDAAVPPEKVGAYLRDFRSLLNKHGLKASLYGHFGQGCVHCRISFDLTTHDGIRNFMSFLDDASSLVVNYGGSFSAEHGDGQAKALFLPKMYGPELMQAFREFKTIWDPQWKMNPGIEVEPRRPDEDLRLGVNYSPWQPKTYFKYPQDEGSMANAVLRCVGVGKCRRTKEAFMCPSFLATREEKDTTRGRARLLFEMINDGVVKDGWRSKAILESLDLCLGCKGCKSDCPVNVDMATYKSEFLAHHYHLRPRPRTHYSMGLISLWAHLGGQTPRLANFLGRTPLLRTIVKSLGGVTHHRPLPKFAHEPFSDWHKKRGPRNRTGEPVVLYPDIFNDYFFPQSLKAACLVLEHWGYQVMLPRGWVPETRPFIHYGMLALAKYDLKRTLRQFRSFIRNGLSVIILEPSTCSVFRDELPALLPQNADGCRLTRLTSLLEEFIMEKKLELPVLKGKAILHGHCHQKSVLDLQASKTILDKMGLTWEEPQIGCCGMAGSFGFEKEHYDVSIKIGEENLLPTVRKAEKDTYIVADGFSCRSQIMDGTKRQPMHMAELLLAAFQASGKIPKGAER